MLEYWNFGFSPTQYSIIPIFHYLNFAVEN